MQEFPIIILICLIDAYYIIINYKEKMNFSREVNFAWGQTNYKMWLTD